MRLCRNLALVGLMLALVIAWAPAAQGPATQTFTGKITGVSKGMELDLNKHGSFYTIRLEEYPNIQFHVSPQDAVDSGVIEPGGTMVLTPKHIKGMGWKVKLTCDGEKTGSLKAPVYKVKALERLGD